MAFTEVSPRVAVHATLRTTNADSLPIIAKGSHMNQGKSDDISEAIAAEAFSALSQTRQVSPFSSRPQGLTVDDAYRATPLVRQMYEARGWRVAGRKIGFTNRTMWEQYGVYAPIWGYVFDRSVHDLAATEAISLGEFS